MPGDSPVLHRINIFFALLLLAPLLRAQETGGPEEGLVENPAPAAPVWYRSNASGLAIEGLDSRLRALREDYSLSVAGALPEELPEILVPYYDSLYKIELRTLYEKGKELRRQWIFRSDEGVSRLNASGSSALMGEAPLKSDEVLTGFIEVFNAERFITEERQINADGSELIFRYFYSGKTLTKAETWTKAAAVAEVPLAEEASVETGEAAAGEDEAAPPPAAAAEEVPLVEAAAVLSVTDRYRYTRSGSLRAIERFYHENVDAKRVKIVFPGIVPGLPEALEFVNPSLAYSSDFFGGMLITEGTKITYSTDSRGRVLKETRTNEEGLLTAEVLNTWNGDRLESVLWKSGDEERLTEFEYDEGGGRTVQRDLKNGVLERAIMTYGNREIEELYMDGEPILRAVWEDGRKISEERIRGRNGKR
jgi:hypothetical protein